MNKLYLSLIVWLCAWSALSAQTKKVSGQVLDQITLEPVIGANILAVGTSRGTVTDIDGNYSIEIDQGDTLEFSYIGYTSLRLSSDEIQLNPIVYLNIDIAQLSEIVVTALGVEREEKALGYSTQHVDSKQLDAVRSSNPFTALKGKVAGLEVNTSNNGLASSSRIVIRGENSLDINGNSPLIVVDGTPINNDIYGIGGFNTDQANLPTDYGNAALDINPGDIESVNVLKGAAASALYGSRGGNGVILITTKSGKNQSDKLGVSYSLNTSWSTPLRLPTVQNEYGGGWGLEYYSDYGTNFGPRFDQNLTIAQDGHPGFANGEEVPFQHRFDFNDFFRTGFSTTSQVSLTGRHDKGNFRLSYSNSRNEGMVPNTNLDKNNVSVNTSYDISDKWKVNISGTYINSKSDNIPVAGYGNQGVMYNLIWNYTNVDLDWLRDYWVEEDLKQNRLFSWGDNPFFITNENLNGFNKDRIFGNINTSYQITPELSARLRVGKDNFDDLRTSRRPWDAGRFPNGMYREQMIAFTEDNYDLLVSYNKTFGDFSTVISAGANRMNRTVTDNTIQGNGLTVPGIYNLGNINVTPVLRGFSASKRINSVYAFANIGYKGYLFLDLTARNDWSSTLPAEHNSYFYPSASLSFIVSDVFDLPKTIDYLKVRANVAQLGMDTDPYRLLKTYQFGTLPNSITNPSLLPNEDLKPVTNTSVELGLQGKFFDSRLAFDFGVYNTISTDQIINAGLSEASGFEGKVVNAGEIETKGLELSINGSPIRTDQFDWNVGMNFSTSRSIVNELYQDLETFIIAEGPDGATVEARPGGRLGDIYGNVFLRSPDGQMVFSDNGLPTIDPVRRKVGNYNPDWMMGLNTSVSYKGFSAYALFNIRKGGYIYSYTNAIGSESGLLDFTTQGHEDGIIGDGVVLNEDGSYSPNTNRATAEAWYYYGGYYSRNNVEANGFDASFIKLKEVSIAYDLPYSFTTRLGLSSVRLALTGSNLALWTDVPNIDPEAQALNGGTLVPGFEVVQLPTARSFGFKLDISL